MYPQFGLIKNVLIISLVDFSKIWPDQCWSGQKVRKKVFNWSEVHLHRSNLLPNPYVSNSDGQDFDRIVELLWKFYVTKASFLFLLHFWRKIDVKEKSSDNQYSFHNHEAPIWHWRTLAVIHCSVFSKSSWPQSAEVESTVPFLAFSWVHCIFFGFGIVNTELCRLCYKPLLGDGKIVF